MRNDILRCVLFFMMTGYNPKPDTIVCEWGPSSERGIIVTIPKDSSYYGNSYAVSRVLFSLDERVDDEGEGKLYLPSPHIPKDVLLDVLPFEADVLPCKRSPYEFIVRVDI